LHPHFQIAVLAIVLAIKDELNAKVFYNRSRLA
jgi:hypothetical protein